LRPLRLQGHLARFVSSVAFLTHLDRTVNKSSYDPSGRRPRKVSVAEPSAGGAAQHEVDALRNEVKALADANKALALYARKILGRIATAEGLEHILTTVDSDQTEPAPVLPVSNSPPKP